MNSKIKELHIKVLKESENMRWNIEDSEKFAELIIRECLGCCEQVISDPVPKSKDTWLNGGWQCIEEIKYHFGIEK